MIIDDYGKLWFWINVEDKDNPKLMVTTKKDEVTKTIEVCTIKSIEEKLNDSR